MKKLFPDQVREETETIVLGTLLSGNQKFTESLEQKHPGTEPQVEV